MIKILLSLALTLFLFSCATGPKTETEKPKTPEVKAEKPKGDQKTVDMKPVAETKAEPEEVKPAKYEALDAAIKSGSEERIRNTSVDILQTSPKDIKALNSLAMLQFKKGNYEAAGIILDKVLSIEPKSSAAYSNLGLIQLVRNEKAEAVGFFKKALEYDNSNHAAAANLGSIYVKEKDFQKAIVALDNAVDSGKADEGSMTNYAIALTATGKAAEAAEIYDKILKKNPSNKNAMLNLAVVYIDRLNKFEDGLDLVNRLKFVGADFESRQVIKDLEVKAKAGLK